MGRIIRPFFLLLAVMVLSSCTGSVNAVQSFTKEKNTPYELQVDAEVSRTLFAGKKWLVIGDSISEFNFRATKNYHDYLSEWLGVTVINEAKSSTGYINSYKEEASWLDRVSSYPADVDFITVMGALNDRTHPVGTFGDTDVTTLYGGLDAFYKAMIEKYPNTPIGVITSTPREYCWGKYGPYVGHINAVCDVAAHYSLPLLDLYRCSGLRPWNEENSKKFFSCPDAPNGDGVHPNAEGQLVIAQKMYSFILQFLSA